MPIILDCDCGKKLKARDDLAGKWVNCPACGRGLLVPLPETPAQSIEIQPRESQAAAAPIPDYQPRWRPPDYEAAKHPQPVIAAPAPKLKSAEASWRGFVHYLLLAAMIPLAVETFVSHESGLDRLHRTFEKHPQLRDKFGEITEESDIDEAEFFAEAPDHRLDGAFLARSSWGHWLFAIVATGIFFTIVVFAIPNFPARPLGLFLSGLFTGTFGVLLLTGIQLAGLFGFCCVLAAYVAALDPNAPFGASLIGFFFGVGFLEEFVKSIPVLWLLYRYDGVGWRTACAIGMASGAGFGISEGVFYCSEHYNGIESAGVYFVRFLSCVSFHTVLSGACAILLQRKQKYLHEGTDFFDWIMTFMAIISVPILLHGLFDTLVKKDLNVFALLVAIGGFAWLAWLIKQCRDRELTISVSTNEGPKYVRTAQGIRAVRT